MANDNELQTGTLPPYVSFPSLMNALGKLTEDEVPDRIDKTVLKSFSGSQQRQLLQALKFLGFTNENDKRTDLFIKYGSSDENGQKEILKNRLESCYGDQIVDLKNGTLQQIRDSFKSIKAEGSVKNKCITFFLKLAEYSGFAISPHIAKGMRTRTVLRKKNNGKKKQTKKTKRTINDQPDNTLSKPGLKEVPIPLGIGRTWYVFIEEEYNQQDIKKFVNMIGLALSEESEQ